MAEDKKTIGLTEVNKKTMELVVEKIGFKQDIDAARFAFAFAVKRGCKPVATEGIGTIWNVGSLDEGGEIRAIVENLFEDVETPYRAVESLINSGFDLLGTEISANPKLRVEDLIEY